MKILLVGLNAKYIHSALAVHSLAAACRMRGQDVDTAEYTINQELLFILREIIVKEPVAVGVACYIWNIELVGKLVAALKTVRPNLLIILGGPEVSFTPGAILGRYAAVDYVISGEGEESLPELVEAVDAGEPTTNLSGVFGRETKTMPECAEQRVVEQLNRLPFPYREADLINLHNRIVYFESSRGCPFSCSYCLSSKTSGVRWRSTGQVKDDLDRLLKAGVRQIKFVDRTFNLRPDHYQTIWEFLLARHESTNCHFEIVADLLSEEDFSILSQAPPGKFQFEIGVQTIMPEALHAIGRKHDWDKLVANVKRLRLMNTIHIHLDLIAELPYETWADFKNSFNAVYSLQPHMLQLGFLKMLPGAPIESERRTLDYQTLQNPPYEILSNQFLSFEEVGRLKQMEEVLNQTYNTGRYSFTLAFMVDCWGADAFSFYNDFAQWWAGKKMLGVAHGAEAILSVIQEFAEDKLTPAEFLWVSELLKADVLMDSTGSIQGRALNWNDESWRDEKADFWRDEARVRKYAPNYRFSNWREVKRFYPVEIFAVNIVEWLKNGGLESKKTAVLFIREEKRPVHWVLLDGKEISGLSRVMADEP